MTWQTLPVHLTGRTLTWAAPVLTVEAVVTSHLKLEPNADGHAVVWTGTHVLDRGPVRFSVRAAGAEWEVEWERV